jgi:hypothetical protein
MPRVVDRLNAVSEASATVNTLPADTVSLLGVTAPFTESSVSVIFRMTCRDTIGAPGPILADAVRA